ncbi:MAG: amino acid permease [Planctomycetes bacterium]|nr:amino acid permease [Planctomycetota bacterium]
MKQDLPRSIGFWGGTGIMVGIMIGSGIFRTPTSIAQELGSTWQILLLWFLGGLLSLAGALTYAELGTMFPRSGGIYAYMYEGLGGTVAFIFGWTYMLLGKPLAASAITTVFSEHFNRLFGLQWDERIVTCVVLILLTAINTVRVQLGAGLAIFFTTLKALALIAIVVLGLSLAQGSTANFAPVESPKSFLAALAPVLAAILWTYDGWADVTSVAGEVRNPHRLLPRILLVGTAGCVVLFVAVNAVYIYMVPLPQMRTVPTVAPLVMERLCGPIGGTVVTIMVMISTLGASHGSIITGARVTFAQARDGLLFRFLGRIHPRYQTPDVSLWVQGLLSCVAVIFLQRFERLTGGFVFTMWIFYAAAAVAMIVLRVRRPDLPRAYRCWGYPVVPILFIAASILMTVLAIDDSPRETLPWLAILVAGAPAYYLWRRFVPAETA